MLEIFRANVLKLPDRLLAAAILFLFALITHDPPTSARSFIQQNFVPS